MQPHEWRGLAKDADDGWNGAFTVPAWKCAKCERPLGGNLKMFTAAMDSPSAPIEQLTCERCGTVYRNPNPVVVLERRRMPNVSAIRCHLCPYRYDVPHADSDRHIALHVTTVHPAHLYAVEDTNPLQLSA